MRRSTRPAQPPTCLQLSATNPHCYVAGFGYANVYGSVPGEPSICS